MIQRSHGDPCRVIRPAPPCPPNPSLAAPVRRNCIALLCSRSVPGLRSRPAASSPTPRQFPESSATIPPGRRLLLFHLVKILFLNFLIVAVDHAQAHLHGFPRMLRQ